MVLAKIIGIVVVVLFVLFAMACLWVSGMESDREERDENKGDVA